MFLHVCVILFTGGGGWVPGPRGPGPKGGLVPGGVPGPGEGGAWWRSPGMATAAGGTHPTGMHSCV